jgi:hypothetical protein
MLSMHTYSPQGRRQSPFLAGPDDGIAQTHLAFIRFHNRVVDSLTSVPEALRFAKAREVVTKHYQWMIRTDYLPRICAAGVVNDVFKNGRKAFEPNVSRAYPSPPRPCTSPESRGGAFRALIP